MTRRRRSALGALSILAAGTMAASLALTQGATSHATAARAASAAAAPTDGWTQLSWNSSSYNVQNWTDAPLNERFTITNGVYNINVHSGEKRVEMRWDDWADQKKENMWEADVLLDSGSTKTAIMQIKSNEDGEPIYVQVNNTKGDLRNDGDSSPIARNMYGKWFNLKCAFNPATGVGRIWIDNALVKTRQYAKGGTTWYFKNGAYNNGLPSGARTSVHFKNIKLWRNDQN
jgi:hypothetical protein